MFQLGILLSGGKKRRHACAKCALGTHLKTTERTDRRMRWEREEGGKCHKPKQRVGGGEAWMGKGEKREGGAGTHQERVLG